MSVRRSGVTGLTYEIKGVVVEILATTRVATLGKPYALGTHAHTNSATKHPTTRQNRTARWHMSNRQVTAHTVQVTSVRSHIQVTGHTMYGTQAYMYQHTHARAHANAGSTPANAPIQRRLARPLRPERPTQPGAGPAPPRARATPAPPSRGRRCPDCQRGRSSCTTAARRPGARRRARRPRPRRSGCG